MIELTRTKKRDDTIDIIRIINDIVSAIINFKQIAQKITMNIKIDEVHRSPDVKNHLSTDDMYNITECLIIVFSDVNYSIFSKIRQQMKESIGQSSKVIDGLIANIYKSWISIPFWKHLRKFNNRKIGKRDMIVTFRRSGLGFITTVTASMTNGDTEEAIISVASDEIRQIFESVYIEIENEIEERVMDVEKCRDTNICILCRMNGFPICDQCSISLSE